MSKEMIKHTVITHFQRGQCVRKAFASLSLLQLSVASFVSFDPNQEILATTDASNHVLGAI